jgi:hypothetical protein
MPNHVYLSYNIACYAMVVVLSILIKDIGLLLDLVSASSCTILVFTLPGLMYIYSVKMFRKEQKSSSLYKLAIFYVLVSIVIFGIEITSIVTNTKDDPLQKGQLNTRLSVQMGDYGNLTNQWYSKPA